MFFGSTVVDNVPLCNISRRYALRWPSPTVIALTTTLASLSTMRGLQLNKHGINVVTKNNEANDAPKQRVSQLEAEVAQLQAQLEDQRHPVYASSELHQLDHKINRLEEDTPSLPALTADDSSPSDLGSRDDSSVGDNSIMTPVSIVPPQVVTPPRFNPPQYSPQGELPELPSVDMSLDLPGADLAIAAQPISGWTTADGSAMLRELSQDGPVSTPRRRDSDEIIDTASLDEFAVDLCVFDDTASYGSDSSGEMSSFDE